MRAIGHLLKWNEEGGEKGERGGGVEEKEEEE